MALTRAIAVGDFLAAERATILDSAISALHRRGGRHYGELDVDAVRVRLDRLYDVVADAVARRELADVRAYAHVLARQRFEAGYDLGEVQTALNILEEALWSHVFAHLTPAVYAETLAPISTVLGVIKDELAREYVSLATQTHAPSLDVRALFSGTERR